MERVEAFKTPDGEVFAKAIDAKRHESRLALVETFNDAGYYGDTRTRCGADLVSFLEEHMDAVKAFVCPEQYGD